MSTLVAAPVAARALLTEASVLGVGAVGPVPPELAGTAAAAAASGAAPTDWFDHATVLGPRGYKYLPLPSQLSLAAGRRALSGVDLEAVPSTSRSLWVAASTAAASLHEPMDATVRSRGADLLSPLGAPFFSINLAAGRLSSELLSHGGATTYTTPGTAGLDALAGAVRMTDPRRATGHVLAVVLAVEVAPPAGEPGAEPPESGAVALVLGTTGRPGRARVSVRRGSWGPRTAEADLSALVDACAADGAPVRLLAAPQARAALPGTGYLADALVTEVAVGSGSYVPLAAVAAAVRGPGPVVLVVAGPDGRAGAVHVRPGDAEDLPARRRPQEETA
ncbi:MAG: hypothetical protein ACFCVG_07825 [Kineosporiaceae bacterium]